MKILIMNIDSVIPNIALEKIKLYHKTRGDEVWEDFPLMQAVADKIYVSCVFDWNKQYMIDGNPLVFNNDKVLIGGSGWDINVKLPEEIEEMKPKINYGFTTRGCIRHCKFCIVPQKEGMIRATGDIYDLWDRKSKVVVLLDNNILALPEHFFKIASQLKNEKLRVDFNQGCDHRLLTPEIAKELMSLKYKFELKFAFDHISSKATVKRAFELLYSAGMKEDKTRWLCYVGPDDTFDSIYERLLILKEHHQLAFVMRDRRVKSNPEYLALYDWTATPEIWKKTSSIFEAIENSGMKSRYKLENGKIVKR
jgi:hypothetical protein